MSVSWIVDCLSIFALCILIIGMAIPRVQLLAYRKNLLDKPAKRKVHKAPTPRLGGTTFLPALMLSFTIVVAVNIVTRQGELLAEVASESLPLASVFCALILSYILGVVDDIRGVGYHVKFIAQSISVLIIISVVWNCQASAPCCCLHHGLSGRLSPSPRLPWYSSSMPSTSSTASMVWPPVCASFPLSATASPLYFAVKTSTPCCRLPLSECSSRFSITMCSAHKGKGRFSWETRAASP